MDDSCQYGPDATAPPPLKQQDGKAASNVLHLLGGSSVRRAAGSDTLSLHPPMLCQWADASSVPLLTTNRELVHEAAGHI